MDFWLSSLSLANVSDIFVNVHAHASIVHGYLSRVARETHLNLQHAFESKLLGSAGTLSLHRSFGENADHVIVIYGDNYSEIDLQEMIDRHVDGGHSVTMLLFRSKSPKEAGIAKVVDGVITEFEEKPSNPKSDLANAGVYIFDKKTFKEVVEMSVRDIGHDVLPRLVGRMHGYETDNYHQDIGDRVRLAHAHKHALNNTRALSNTTAVFTDRDGTLVEHIPYLSDPTRVKALPGAVEAVRKLKDKGFKVIVVTNQSGLGRGKISPAQLSAVNTRVNEVFEGMLDDTYWSSVVPATTADRTMVEHFDRKPGPGLVWEACITHGIDLRKSYMVGDALSDVYCGKNAGCRRSFAVGFDKQLPSTATAVQSFAEATEIICAY